MGDFYSWKDEYISSGKEKWGVGVCWDYLEEGDCTVCNGMDHPKLIVSEHNNCVEVVMSRYVKHWMSVLRNNGFVYLAEENLNYHPTMTVKEAIRTLMVSGGVFSNHFKFKGDSPAIIEARKAAKKRKAEVKAFEAQEDAFSEMLCEVCDQPMEECMDDRELAYYQTWGGTCDCVDCVRCGERFEACDIADTDPEVGPLCNECHEEDASQDGSDGNDYYDEKSDQQTQTQAQIQAQTDNVGSKDVAVAFERQAQSPILAQTKDELVFKPRSLSHKPKSIQFTDAEPTPNINRANLRHHIVTTESPRAEWISSNKRTKK